jgi:predicted DNA-binding transcriptional regulator YafY
VRHRGEWYLLAYCHLREAQRTFALSRIRRAQMQARTFAIPKNFDAEKLLENRFGIFGGDREFRVRLVFDARTAPYAAERQWHARQVLNVLADGGAELTFPATDLREVMRWVLSWGAGARVMAPLELREMVRQELAWAAQAYGVAGSS